LYGNLKKEKISEIIPRIYTSEVYNRYKFIEESSCRDCEYFEICRGGCVHEGFLTNGNFKTRSILCTAYRKIFAHIKMRLKEANMLGI
jgi:radical SAM protein with 4Fe4S-binding SPASM domain